MSHHSEPKVMSSEDDCDICQFLWQYLIGILTIAITLVAVYTLYCYKKQKFCFRKSDNDENNPNQCDNYVPQ